MRLLLALLLSTSMLATGCLSSGRSRAPRDDRRDPEPPPTDKAWWEIEGASRKGRTAPTTPTKGDRDSIVAGEVFDLREGRRLKGITFVNVRLAEDAAPAKGRGTGVETDGDGYFYMAGLIPGKTYILTAVREIDGRKVAGEVQIKPPASRIRIDLSENKVSSITPLIPPPVGASGPYADSLPDPSSLLPPGPLPGTNGETGWSPGATPPPSASNLPPLPARPSVTRPESVAGVEGFRPPTASIRPPPEAAPSKKYDESPPMSRIQGRIPNFIVSDLDGRDWDSRYPQGRLVLMDFWSTTCAPCLRAVPSIKKLQSDYGATGLEVVAVALEANAPINDRIREVDEVARNKQLNYRVYVERDGKVGEIAKLFEVRSVPTLVLLDRQGGILWRGGVGNADLDRLDDVIRNFLTKRD